MPNAEGNTYKRLKFTKKHSRHFLKKAEWLSFQWDKDTNQGKKQNCQRLTQKVSFSENNHVTLDTQGFSK